jgi:hypothetical protein
LKERHVGSHASLLILFSRNKMFCSLCGDWLDVGWRVLHPVLRAQSVVENVLRVHARASFQQDDHIQVAC